MRVRVLNLLVANAAQHYIKPKEVCLYFCG
jgi:hypothetical protein